MEWYFLAFSVTIFPQAASKLIEFFSGSNLGLSPLLPPANEVTGRKCFHMCLSVHKGLPVWPLPMMHWTSLKSYPLDIRFRTPASDIYWWSLETCSNLFIWGPHGASSGGGRWNWSNYRFQAGGTYPTGILSCLSLSYRVWVCIADGRYRIWRKVNVEASRSSSTCSTRKGWWTSSTENTTGPWTTSYHRPSTSLIPSYIHLLNHSGNHSHPELHASHPDLQTRTTNRNAYRQALKSTTISCE